MKCCIGLIAVVLIAITSVTPAPAQDVQVSYSSESELAAAFAGARKVDLAECKVSSVVTLRDVVKIPPPSTTVLVKDFRRGALPQVLEPAFAKPGIMGVTIAGKYVAILETDLHKEYMDTLRHELVHAYISLASPEPLPFWFQEGSAVHFSTDKPRKFYGQPSDKQVGVMVGRTVELPDVYKQKLQSFHYLIEKVGKEKFYEWYRNAVETGVVDASTLLGLDKAPPPPPRTLPKRIPIWAWAVTGLVVIVVAVIGIYSARRESEYL